VTERENLSTSDRRAIAEQIGACIGHPREGSGSHIPLFSSTDVPQLRLAESLEIWHLRNVGSLGFDRPMRNREKRHRLIEFAINTSHWHHQIRGLDRDAVGYAHSRFMPGTGPPSVGIERLAASPVARQLEAALRFADKRLRRTKAVRARLLMLPELHVWALWLEKTRLDELMLVSQPGKSYRLFVGRIYPWRAFLGVIARQLKRTHHAQRRPPVATGKNKPLSEHALTTPPN
jgi:hypothetical protein